MKRLPETWDYSTALKWNPFTITGDAAQIEDDVEELLLHLEDLFMNERFHSSSEEGLLAWLTYYSINNHIELQRVLYHE